MSVVIAEAAQRFSYLIMEPSMGEFGLREFGRLANMAATRQGAAEEANAAGGAEWQQNGIEAAGQPC